MQPQQLSRFFELCHLAERLKSELRHSWLATGRQESVAEHCWRLSLMLILMEPHLQQPIDIAKVLKMAIIHDLVEAIVGDIPVFEIDQARAVVKAEKEQQAIEKIRNILSNSVGDEIYAYWQEFELAESYEAKLVYAFDKLECKCQHLEADLSTWNDQEKACSFDWQDALYDFDPAVLQVRDYLLTESQKKAAKDLESTG